MAAATGYHCGTCGVKVDSTGVTHTPPVGATYTTAHAARPVADNWPEVKKP